MQLWKYRCQIVLEWTKERVVWLNQNCLFLTANEAASWVFRSRNVIP